MKIYSIYILNKAGGLIYQNNINAGLNKLTANDYLVLAGTLHGVHAISSKLTPTIIGKENPSADINDQNTTSNAALLSTGRTQNSNTNKTGLQSIETDLFNLYVFQTLTGLKFIIITSPNPIVHNLQSAGPDLHNRSVSSADYNSVSSKGELQKQYEVAGEVFRQLYVIYSDYVMKDPFYSLDMPIKSYLFDIKVGELVASV